MDGKRKRSNIVGPFILIGLGVLFLMQNLGIVDVDIWNVIWRFWPVFLIASGLEMVLGSRSNWGYVVGIVVVVIALGFGADALRALRQGPGDNQAARSNLLNTESSDAVAITQPLDGIERAKIDIETGISGITIRTSETAQLVEGSVVPHRNEEIRSSFSKDGDTGYFSLSSKSSGPLGFFNFGGNDSAWDLALNRTIPMQLAIDTGAGNADLDLQRLNLTD